MFTLSTVQSLFVICVPLLSSKKIKKASLCHELLWINVCLLERCFIVIPSHSSDWLLRHCYLPQAVLIVGDCLSLIVIFECFLFVFWCSMHFLPDSWRAALDAMKRSAPLAIWLDGNAEVLASHSELPCTHHTSAHTHTGTHTVAHHVFIVHDLFGFWRCREVLNSLPFCLFSVFLIEWAASCLVTAVQIQHMKFNEVLNEGFSNWKLWEKTNCFYG